jgi:hypothetical protein
MNTEPVLTVASITAAVIALIGIVGFNVDPSAVDRPSSTSQSRLWAAIARSKVKPVKS